MEFSSFIFDSALKWSIVGVNIQHEFRCILFVQSWLNGETKEKHPKMKKSKPALHTQPLKSPFLIYVRVRPTSKAATMNWERVYEKEQRNIELDTQLTHIHTQSSPIHSIPFQYTQRVAVCDHFRFTITRQSGYMLNACECVWVCAYIRNRCILLFQIELALTCGNSWYLQRYAIIFILDSSLFAIYWALCNGIEFFVDSIVTNVARSQLHIGSKAEFNSTIIFEFEFKQMRLTIFSAFIPLVYANFFVKSFRFLYIFETLSFYFKQLYNADFSQS